MILPHDLKELFVARQLEEPARAIHRAAEAARTFEFLFRFCDRAVVERELLSVADVLDGKHPDAVLVVHLFHLDHGLAVRVAAVGKSRGEVTVQDRVHSEDIVTSRVVEVPLVRDVVKVGEVLAQFTLELALLQDVLAFVPVPCLVDLSEVLHDQAVAFNAFFPFAEDPEALRVNPKVGVVLAREVFDRSQNDLSKLTVGFRKQFFA